MKEITIIYQANREINEATLTVFTKANMYSKNSLALDTENVYMYDLNDVETFRSDFFSQKKSFLKGQGQLKSDQFELLLNINGDCLYRFQDGQGNYKEIEGRLIDVCESIEFPDCDDYLLKNYVYNYVDKELLFLTEDSKKILKHMFEFRGLDLRELYYNYVKNRRTKSKTPHIDVSSLQEWLQKRINKNVLIGG